jgi:hypothetical protein
MTQVVECLRTKCEAQSLNPVLQGKNKTKQNKTDGPHPGPMINSHSEHKAGRSGTHLRFPAIQKGSNWEDHGSRPA